MQERIRPLIAGNWKMNGINSSLSELCNIASGIRAMSKHFDVLLCLPSTLLSRALDTVQGTGLLLGGQDCHADERGAYTGDVSAQMLRDAGASYVIVGHSERRINHGETDACVLGKVVAAWKADMKAIVCIGETFKEKKNGETLEIIIRQCQNSIPDKAVIKNLIIAYEPVWSIGSGKIPTDHDIADIYTTLRNILCHRFGFQSGVNIPLIYGGSVNQENVESILAIKNVNGVLVGGASLRSEDFLAICRVAKSIVIADDERKK